MKLIEEEHAEMLEEMMRSGQAISMIARSFGVHDKKTFLKKYPWIKEIWHRVLAEKEAETQEMLEEERRLHSQEIYQWARMGLKMQDVCRKMGWKRWTINLPTRKWARELYDKGHSEYVNIRIFTFENILTDIANKQKAGEKLEQWEALIVERERERMRRHKAQYRLNKDMTERRRLELEILRLQAEKSRRQMDEGQQEVLVQLAPMSGEEEQAALNAWKGEADEGI